MGKCIFDDLDTLEALRADAEKKGMKALQIAHDDGVYLCGDVWTEEVAKPGTAAAAEGKKIRRRLCLHARGTDPAKHDDWYERAHDLVGGDDFVEDVPLSALRRPEGAEYFFVTFRGGSMYLGWATKMPPQAAPEGWREWPVVQYAHGRRAGAIKERLDKMGIRCVRLQRGGKLTGGLAVEPTGLDRCLAIKHAGGTVLPKAVTK